MITVNLAQDLSRQQIERMQKLVDACIQYEGLTLSFPDLERENAIVYQYFTSKKQKDPQSILIVFPEEEYAEITAFTHPSCRCRGYFTSLFQAFLDENEEVPVCFYPDGCSYDALAALEMLECEYSCTEHLMQCELKKFQIPELSLASFSLDVCDNIDKLAQIHGAAFDMEFEESKLYLEQSLEDNVVCWLIQKDSIPIGMCIGAADETDVYLFGFCILPEYQGKGNGTKALLRLLNCLSGVYDSVRVQVAEENAAAYQLYCKAGFKSVEEVMEYWY